MPPRLGRVVADRRQRAVIQAGDDLADRNQAVSFQLHGFILACSSDKTAMVEDSAVAPESERIRETLGEEDQDVLAK